MDNDIPEWLRQDMQRTRRITRRQQAEPARIVVVGAIAVIVLLAVLLQPLTVVRYEYERADMPSEKPRIDTQVAYAGTYYVTGYNTVPEQTDSTPCIAASGDDICGRRDVVACPRAIPLGTELEIDGERYVCLDRLAPKYDNRIDISCDKDMQCPARVTGYKLVTVKK